MNPLITNEELQQAQEEGVEVTVIQRKETVGSGVIERFTLTAVRIGGAWYTRFGCSFWV